MILGHPVALIQHLKQVACFRRAWGAVCLQRGLAEAAAHAQCRREATGERAQGSLERTSRRRPAR
jgi:hypothetical protein